MWVIPVKEKAKKIYERLVELNEIAKNVDSDCHADIYKAMVNWWKIYVDEEYQSIMNDADKVHQELMVSWGQAEEQPF